MCCFPLDVFLTPWLQSLNRPLNLYKFHFQSVFPEHRAVSSFRPKASFPLVCVISVSFNLETKGKLFVLLPQQKKKFHDSRSNEVS